ncbi:monocarboxylate transporter 13-like isoform X2 [Rhynchophorus ferrugineus]
MRKIAFCGSCLMSLGLFLTCFASSYLYLIFSVSILTGIGQGTVMPATYLATYSYFKKRLTIATSLSVTGASMAPIFMPKVTDILLSHFGRKITILFLFIISLFSLIGCFLLKPVENPHTADEEQRLRSENKGNGKTEDKATKKSQSIWSILFHAFDLHLLQDVPFVLIVFGLGVTFASELNIILMLQFILQELSLFERSETAIAMSVMSISDILGRLVVPMGAHYFDAPPKLMYGVALVVASMARTVLALWSQNATLVFAVIAVVGLTKGTRAVFQSVIIPKYVPLEKVAGANGINMFFTGAVSLVIGPLIGLVHDKTHSYTYALHSSSLLSLFCVTLWIAEATYEKKRKPIKGQENGV